ncbi:hypothetical protein MCEREM21_01569 [Burkholderiaceae bacterium]|jgi:hypothetical protein
MDFYLKAEKWNSKKCPDTDSHATPLKTQKLSNVTVIQVKNAKYRLATIEGVFAVVNGRDIKVSKSGKHTKKVFCTWYGHQIQTDFPELTLDPNHTEVIENYTGKVVVDIGKNPKAIEAKVKAKPKAKSKKTK